VEPSDPCMSSAPLLTLICSPQVDSVDLSIRPVSYILSGSHPVLQSTVIETVSPRLQPRLPGQANPPSLTAAAPPQDSDGTEADDDFGSFEEAGPPPQPAQSKAEKIEESAGQK
jgi:hypothetical protein